MGQCSFVHLNSSLNRCKLLSLVVGGGGDLLSTLGQFLWTWNFFSFGVIKLERVFLFAHRGKLMLKPKPLYVSISICLNLRSIVYCSIFLSQRMCLVTLNDNSVRHAAQHRKFQRKPKKNENIHHYHYGCILCILVSRCFFPIASNFSKQKHPPKKNVFQMFIFLGSFHIFFPGILRDPAVGKLFVVQ